MIGGLTTGRMLIAQVCRAELGCSACKHVDSGAALCTLLRPKALPCRACCGPSQLTVRSAALNGTLPQGAVDACKIGCTIAIRYAADRPQVTVLACSAAGLLLAGSLN